MKEIIESLYGSVDNLLKETKPSISRSYIYKILKKDKKNITLQVAQELKEILKLNTLEELIIILDETNGR